MQSNRNKNLIYIQKETVHNIMNLSFSILGSLLLLIVLMLSSITSTWSLVVYSSLFLIFMLSRIIINIKIIVSFNNLVKKVNPENIDFYITKSWTRKKEGSLWVGLIYIFTLIILLIITGLLGLEFYIKNKVITYIVLVVHMFIIIIVMFTMMQILDSNIKVAEKRINIHSVEWIQIKNDQSSYYKMLFIWYIHIILILPLILMLIPFYRRFWDKVVKN